MLPASRRSPRWWCCCGVATYASARLREPADRARPVVDALLPVTLLVVLVTGFVLEGIRISVTDDPWGRWSPVGWRVGQRAEAGGRGESCAGCTSRCGGCTSCWAVPWWPRCRSPSWPISSSPPSTCSSPRPARRLSLRTGGLRARRAHSGWPARVQLDAKKALELESCTECGRCQAVCPAYAAGQPLSPKALVLDLRDHVRGLPARDPVHLDPSARRGRCSEGVPPLIAAASPRPSGPASRAGPAWKRARSASNHVPTIVDMRRHLVMELASAPERLQGSLANLDARGTPYVGMSTSRTAWMGDLAVPRMADRQRVQLLYWVGCAASFDERGQKVARAIATLLGRAGVDYAVLGDEESCTGDPARRIGDEVLFTMSAERVIETLARYQFDAIVTGCAHCYHSLKNEYPAFGGHYQVRHHTEVLRRLLRQRRLVSPAADADPGDLPRPVLPRALQRRVRPARGRFSGPFLAWTRSRCRAAGADQFLLRRRGRPELHNGSRRGSHQPRPRRPGPRQRAPGA